MSRPLFLPLAASKEFATRSTTRMTGTPFSLVEAEEPAPVVEGPSGRGVPSVEQLRDDRYGSGETAQKDKGENLTSNAGKEQTGDEKDQA